MHLQKIAMSFSSEILKHYNKKKKRRIINFIKITGNKTFKIIHR